jgi:hypothetical protein
MFGGNMKFMGRLQGAAVVAAVVVGMVGFGSTSAQATAEDNAATWITNAALNTLGVEVEDPGLTDTLTNAVQAAVDAGLISDSVDDLAQQAVADPESVDSDEAGDTLDDALEDQTGQWQDITAQWHEAFDQIKADFATCREAATDGAADCAHQFRYAMQVNHIKAWQARHEAKLGDISALPADQQARALEKLKRQGEHAQARLDKAAALLERQTGDTDNSDEADADDSDAGDATADPPKSTKDKKVKDHKVDKANRGHHGSAGNNGKSGR